MRAAARAAEPGLIRLVRRALAEDVGDGDRTTAWTVPDGMAGAGRIVAKADGVLAGTGPADRVFREVDEGLTLEWRRSDGDPVRAGDEVLRVRGALRSILTAERTALNFLGHLSGIATLASRYAAAVAGTGATVVDTRKTLPGLRALQKAAVRAGGCANHRTGLYDMVLIKENHIRAAGGVAAALRRAAPEAEREGLAVEIEVRDEAELEEALRRPPDRILLDNMPPEGIARAVARVRRMPEPHPELEASGGIGLDDVRAIAETGIDLISVGALTHSAPALDLSLLLGTEEARDT